MKNINLFAISVIVALSGCTNIDNEGVIYTLPEEDLITEGITYSKGANTFFVGSIYKQKILSIKEGEIKELITNGQYGAKSIGGLKVDEKRNVLWAVSAQAPYRLLQGGEPWLTGIFKFEPQTGNLLGKYTLNDTATVFNDLVIDSAGNIYISDTFGGGIYTITTSSDSIQVYLPRQTFKYPNGITISDGLLFIADGEGLWKVNLTTKEKQMVTVPSNETLGGIDGLYSYGKDFIAIQNGVSPRRVIRIIPNDQKSTAAIEVLYEREAERKYYSPTTGVIIDDSFYFLYNSQVRSMDSSKNIFPLSELEPVQIYKINLR